MKKWYTILTVLVVSVVFAACSGDPAPDETAPDATPEEAAPAAEDEGSSSAEAPSEEVVAAEAHGHSHGEDGGHTHAAVAEVSELGSLVAALDGSATMEVGCGSCSYGMDGVEGCVLAAVIDDEPFLVTGIEFDTHGSGLCKETKTAKVTGTAYEKGIEATSVVLTD